MVFVASLFSTTGLLAAATINTTCQKAIVYRSQSLSLQRNMCGRALNAYEMSWDMERIWGLGSIAPGYQASFDPKSMTNTLFGPALQTISTSASSSSSNSDSYGIVVRGSTYTDAASTARNSRDLLGDYFGLNPENKWTIGFKPEIQSFLLDFNVRIGFDEWAQGLWFEAWAPFVYTNWNLNASETLVNTTASTTALAGGYFSQGATASTALVQTPLGFFKDGKTPTLAGSTTPAQTAPTFEALKYAKFGQKDNTKATNAYGLADLRFGVGYNFLSEEDYHLGLGIMAAAPTGNTPDAAYLFAPIVGNEKHWEVGGMWTSHVIFWRSEESERHMGGYLDANITHLFENKQKRTLDLKNKALSRYMVAQKMRTTVAGTDQLYASGTAGGTDGGTLPGSIFNDRFAPVANLSTVDVNVSIGVQVNLVAMLNYTHEGLSFDLGYNLWATSCQKVKLATKNAAATRLSTESWALKGNSSAYGWRNDNGTDTSANIPQALSATQSEATVFNGTTTTAVGGTTVTYPNTNLGIDTPQYAQIAGATGGTVNGIIQNQEGNIAAANQIRTSSTPVLLSNADLNTDFSAKGLTNSVFADFSYTFLEMDDWQPFVGIGFQGEFSSNPKIDLATATTAATSSDSSNPCSDCDVTSPSQWNVFVKGGITFN